MIGSLPTATEAGIAWDAVRMPADLGVALHKHLCHNPDTQDRLGLIVLSERSEATYWLIPTGSTPTWPRGCRLLTRHSSLLLPGLRVHPSSARWLHEPTAPGQLTGAVWLAAAIADHNALEAH